jgi:hypothetical protein
VAEEESGLTLLQRRAKLEHHLRWSVRMKAHPLRIDTDAREPEELPPEPRLFANEDDLTDEEAFYLAQEVGFASLKARYEARPRRKM